MECRIRVAAIVLDRGEVLLVSTLRQPEGPLVPPGGGLEDGETVAQAVAREVREEAGLQVQAGDLIAYRELWREDWHGVELYLQAKLVGGREPEPGYEGEGRRCLWVPAAELPHVPHYPERLGELCRRAAGETPGALTLEGLRY
jgi:ADP-ribose pyrophosphatase YjhB (NUDIX family)